MYHSSSMSEALSHGSAGAASENGGTVGSNHGWQKVTNPKRQRRQEARSNKPGYHETSGSLQNGSAGPESKAFQALEREAEERRMHREALLQAAIMGASTMTAEQLGRDADGDDDYPVDGITSTDESKKLKVEKPKKPKVTVSEAASAIDPSDLAAFLAQVLESFSGSPDIQLMRFADYFVKAFNAVAPTQFGWNKILKEPLAKLVEVPLCYIPESITKTASDWVVGQPVTALSDFLIWGLNDVATEMQPHQGGHNGTKVVAGQAASKTKVGVLAVLAIVLRKRPGALLQKTAVLRSNPLFQSQDKLALLSWAYGQAAQGDLVMGMQLWVQNLLPVACGKNSTPSSRDITLQFAESILFANLKKAKPILQNGASRKGERLVSAAALDSMMRMSFPTEQARTKATERFQVIYPFVKEIALFGPHSSKSTKSVAQLLLPLCLEAACEDVPTLVNEACSILVWCLLENADCFKQWEKLYFDKLKGSVNVLSHICAEWRTIVGQLTSFDNLKKTLYRFKVENASAQGNTEVVLLLKTSDVHCRVLQRRMARAGPCLSMVATLMAGAGIAYAFYLLKFDML